MKILHVYKTSLPFSFGGIEQNIFDIINSTKSPNLEHEILCTGSGNTETTYFRNVKIVKCKVNFSFSNNPVSLDLVKYLLLNQKKYNLIHFHFPYPMMDISMLLRKYTPYIITYHADLIRSKWIVTLYSFIAKFFLKNADIVIYTSNNYQNYSSFSKYVSKSKVIHLGINHKVKEFQDHKVKTKDNFFLYIGGFRKYKDLPCLIDAANITKLPVYLIGTGKEKKKLESICDKKKIRNLFFLGQLEDDLKFAYLKKCLALILPSNNESEAFGLVLLEAGIMKKPIITANLNSGVTEINIDKKTGLVFNRGDAFDLAKKMVFLKENPDVCKELGNCHYKRTIEIFSIKKMGNKYEDIYNSFKQCK